MNRSGWLALTIAGGAIVYFASLLLVGTRPAHLRLTSD
jgi:hypothetical protein